MRTLLGLSVSTMMLFAVGCSPETEPAAAASPAAAQTAAKSPARVTPPSIQTDGWKITVGEVERSGSVFAGADTYSAKAGHSFRLVKFALHATAMPPQPLTVALRELVLLDGKGDSYHSEAILLPEQQGGYFYGPMMDGALSSKYSCQSALGESCSPLISGSAKTKIGGVEIAITSADDVLTAQLSPDTEQLDIAIAFYLPDSARSLQLVLPGNVPLALPAP